MSATDTNSARLATTGIPANGAGSGSCVVRVIHRDRAGTIHLNWPADQIRAAVDDPEDRSGSISTTPSRTRAAPRTRSSARSSSSTPWPLRTR